MRVEVSSESPVEDARIMQLAWAPFCGPSRVLSACAGVVVSAGRHVLGETILQPSWAPAARVDRLVVSADAIRGGAAADEVEATVTWRGLACEIAEVRSVDDRCHVLVLRDPLVILAGLDAVCVRLEGRGDAVVVHAYFLARLSTRRRAEVSS